MTTSSGYQPVYATDLKLALNDKGHPFWRYKPPRLFGEAHKTIADLILDPYDKRRSHRLLFELEGLRAASLLGGWRILFKICEECTRFRLAGKWPLECCVGKRFLPERTITFLDIRDYHQ